MSVAAMRWALDAEVTGTSERLILMLLADRHGDEGAWPSRKWLADKAHLSPRRVVEILQSLEEQGLIDRLNRYRDNGSQTSNEYALIGVEKYDEKGLRKVGGVRPTARGGCDQSHGGDATHRTPVTVQVTTSRTRSSKTSSSHREETSRRGKVKSKSRTQREARNKQAQDERDLDASTLLEDEETDWDSAPSTGFSLAEYFRRKVDLPWSRENGPALARQIQSWIDDGLPSRSVQLMIELYADEHEEHPVQVPWKNFIARRAWLHAQVQERIKAEEMEAHRDDPDWWESGTAERDPDEKWDPDSAFWK